MLALEDVSLECLQDRIDEPRKGHPFAGVAWELFGARLDARPELLFLLRGVDPAELIGSSLGGAMEKARVCDKTLADGTLSGIFGIDIDEGASEVTVATRKKPKTLVAKRGRPAK